MELNSHSCIQSGKMKICANGVTLEKSDTNFPRAMRDDAQLGIIQSERHDYENPELFSSLPTVFEGKMSVREPKLSSREQLSNTGEYVEYTKFVSCVMFHKLRQLVKPEFEMCTRFMFRFTFCLPLPSQWLNISLLVFTRQFSLPSMKFHMSCCQKVIHLHIYRRMMCERVVNFSCLKCRQVFHLS